MAKTYKKTFYTGASTNIIRFYVTYEITETASNVTLTATDMGIWINESKADSVTFTESGNSAYTVGCLVEASDSTTLAEYADGSHIVTFKKGQHSFLGKPYLEGDFPMLLAELQKKQFPYNYDMFSVKLNYGKVAVKKGTNTSHYVSKSDFYYYEDAFTVPAVGVPLLTISAYRYGQSSAKVVANIESFENDHIRNAVLTVGSVVERPSWNAYVPSSGKLTLEANISGVSNAMQEVSVTVDGDGGTSTVATAVIGVKFNTFNVGAKGKGVAFGGYAPSSPPYNGQLDCYMDANFYGEATFRGGATFRGNTDFSNATVTGLPSLAVHYNSLYIGDIPPLKIATREMTADSDAYGVVGTEITYTGTTGLHLTVSYAYIESGTLHFRIRNNSTATTAEGVEVRFGTLIFRY